MPLPASCSSALGAILLSSLALAGCRSEDSPPQANSTVPANSATPPPEPVIVPAPETRLDRDALLIAAIRARSAAAAGTDDAAQQAELAGRRFQFRIRLGCSLAPDQPAAGVRARFDAEQRRVELEATPDLLLDGPAAAALAGEGFEAVEGHWVPRPWLLAPSCAGADPAQPAVVEPPMVAIGQFYSQADPRTERREGRSYQARQELTGDEAPAPGSWDLVLGGRLRELAGGRVILCRAPSPGAMPMCVISVTFEDVSIENVRTGETLARWGRG